MFLPMRTSEHHSQTLGGDVAERGLYSSDARMWRSGRKSVEDLDARSQESRKAVTQACEGRPIPSECYIRTGRLGLPVQNTRRPGGANVWWSPNASRPPRADAREGCR